MPSDRDYGHEQYPADADRADGEAVQQPEEGVAQPSDGEPPAPDGDAGGAEGADDGEAGDARDGAGDGEAGDARDGAGEEADPLVLLAAERDEYLDLLRRERAEFENFRRRSSRERAEAHDKGAEQLVNELLSVLDNFGHVVAGAEDSDDEQLAKGVEMVHRELWSVLTDAGLEPVPGEGAPFDPTHHEAMMQVEAEETIEEPYVAEVLRPGYRFKGRVLRPASVSVAQ